MKTLLTIVSLGLLVNCAPRHAQQLRIERPITIGFPSLFGHPPYTGFSVRPAGSIGLGMSAGYLAQEGNWKENSDQVYEAYGYTTSAFFQVFPFETSGFFLGGAVAYNKLHYKVPVETDESTTLKPIFRNARFDEISNYAAFPVGFTWIWDSGVTVSLDIAPSIKLLSSRTTDRAEGIDQARQDEEFDRVSTYDSPTYTIRSVTNMIGYSF